MPLTPGTRLGVYEVTALIGEGGMGQVYRALDTNLNRDVALKILPERFALDHERVARFKREAQVLASVNHPQIAAVYGFEEHNGVRALALELVEGPTLADRIAAGAIPMDEALPVARQIAEAVEAAHERGIIHRDLKPANIKLRPDGMVKVLDFGLAKALEPAAAGGADASASPTLTSPAMTQLGLILGTAAYMSPEQARGHAADKRSDIWSFGAVLYEMLSGQRIFKGDDIADTLAAVLRQDVDWKTLPAATPASVRHLLERCLERNVKQRLRDIGEARIVLDRPADDARRNSGGLPSTTSAPSLWRRAIPLFVSSMAIGAVTAAAAWYLKPLPTPTVTRFAYLLPEGQAFLTVGGFSRTVAMSPDGAQMVYVATPARDGKRDADSTNRPQLYLRSMSELEAAPIPGTDLFEGISEPVFSPDGRSIAFFARSDRTLKTIAVSGGVAVTIGEVDVPSISSGLSWGSGGIVFGQGEMGVRRVFPERPTPEVLVRVKDGEEAYGPQLLPDGQHVLFTIATGTARDRWDKARIVVQSRSSGEPKVLIDGGSDGRYVPTGHLVYAVSGTVYAMAFDVERLEVYGRRVPVIQGVRRSAGGINGAASFSVSSTGSLAYIPGPLMATSSELALVERTGTVVERLKLPAGNYATPRVSPDGRRIAFGVDDGKEAIVYTYRLSNEGPMERLTYGGNNRFPIWSADGKRVAFQSDREGDAGIWAQPLGGNAVRLTKAEPGTSHVPESWSPKGDAFLFNVTRGAEVSLQRFSLTDGKASQFGGVRSSNPTNAVFSPDGRWVAYTVTEGLRTTIYVQPYPESGGQVQLVAKGADNPHEAVWSPDGKELFFNPAPSRFESVSVTTRPEFTFGNTVPEVRRLTMTPSTGRRNYDITPDGRFVGLVPAGDIEAAAARPRIVFVLNWYEELKRLVPTK